MVIQFSCKITLLFIRVFLQVKVIQTMLRDLIIKGIKERFKLLLYSETSNNSKI